MRWRRGKAEKQVKLARGISFLNSQLVGYRINSRISSLAVPSEIIVKAEAHLGSLYWSFVISSAAGSSLRTR
jgi:hypothetical protein